MKRSWYIYSRRSGAALLLALMCSCDKSAPSTATEAAPVPGSIVTLRLATYNVRNYNHIARNENGDYRPDWPKPEAEKTALRTVIRAAHADVLALEEMGDKGELEELQHDLAAEGLTYTFTALVKGPDPDRHVAVLSRVPLAAVHPHETIPFKYSGVSDLVKRGLLEVDIVTNGQRWALYVVHLKSRLTETAEDPQSAAEREGEARAVRDLVRKEQALEGGALVAVVGDFNDSRDAPPLKRFTELNSKPLLKIAPTADSRGETWTSAYGRADEYDRSDYILLSPALAPLQKGKGGIADLPGAMTASDHRLVWVDLAFPAVEQKK